MRHLLSWLALVSVLATVAPAAADIPGPNDDLCTVAVQSEGGATCEACTVVRTDPETAHACDELAARGWVLRCGRGGTVHTSVYCDRPAGSPPSSGAAAASGSSGSPSAGESSGGVFGCSAARSAAHTHVVVLAALAVVLAWRERARNARG